MKYCPFEKTLYCRFRILAHAFGKCYKEIIHPFDIKIIESIEYFLRPKNGK